MEDIIYATDLLEIPASRGLLPDLTVKEIEAGHWRLLEAPDVLGVPRYVSSKYPVMEIIYYNNR